LDWTFWKLAIFYLTCLTIFFIDLETMIIPDELSLGLVGLGLGSRLITGGLWDGLCGATVGFGIYFIIGFVSKLIYKKMAIGRGDMKLGAGIGAMWGLWIAIYTVYLSFIVGAIVGLFLIAIKQKARQDLIPFGPMIVVSAMMILVWWF
jgi:leader peptidase (prepilin peptidase)/N-methyltransferase